MGRVLEALRRAAEREGKTEHYIYENSSIFSESSETKQAEKKISSPPRIVEAAPQRTPKRKSSTAPSEFIHPGLASLFDELESETKAANEPVAETFESHYDQGLAYFEMEMIESAIEHFQKAVRLMPANESSRLLHCCNLLGLCFTRMGLDQPAIMWFKRGLSAPGCRDEEYKAIRYELALVYEKTGDRESAIKHFSEIYGIDANYRDVTGKLRDLQVL
jgi:tetratricopeptide (TPR) repeat protein